jgi:hypothetical protein
MRNKPNSARRAKDAKQGQFRGKCLKEKDLWCIGQPDVSEETNPLRCGQMRKTKPICPAGPGRTGPAGRGRRGQSCQTNPISQEVGRGRPTYEEPIVRNKAKLGQNGTSGGWGVTGSLLCETKPIWRQVVEGKNVMVNWSARRFRRNEPNSLPSNAQNEANLPGGAGWDGAPGTWDAGQMRQTNPISRGRDIPAFHCSIIPPSSFDAYRATTPRCPVSFRQRTQFAADGPERPSPRPEALPLPPARRRRCKTKPISGSAGPEGATEGEICKTNPIPGWAGRDEGQMRQTKPNLGRMGHLGDSVPGRANGAERTQFFDCGLPNKPNFARARYPSIPVFYYSSIPTRCRMRKTKPIPGVEPKRRVCNPPP